MESKEPGSKPGAETLAGERPAWLKRTLMLLVAYCVFLAILWVAKGVLVGSSLHPALPDESVTLKVKQAEPRAAKASSHGPVFAGTPAARRPGAGDSTRAEAAEDLPSGTGARTSR